ncbi:hypothetical protein THAOC_04778 [Thalassiosira oceanica]|uniref:Uncharacterized protein n=1 Tax=Thalassiosira oceanica TaxID=159749 RepID=K0TNJ4_THAOC|nr:hypothetical protein THAOC_04778 [Thalassiosira oceanica]|eukprot:EJK73587.1 hypothetical protein THAOC_04778 [Thalassiosira oceanica]
MRAVRVREPSDKASGSGRGGVNRANAKASETSVRWNGTMAGHGDAHYRRREVVEFSCRSSWRADGFACARPSKTKGDDEGKRREHDGAKREETAQTRTISLTPLPSHRGTHTRQGVLLYILAAFAVVPALSLSRADERLESMAAKESAVASDKLTPTMAKLGFPWDRIDPTINGTCGTHKCFFRHVNSIDGFVVSYETDSGEDQVLGWERGLALERDYGLKQLFYQEHPPRKIDLPGPVGNIRDKMKPHRKNGHYKNFAVAPHFRKMCCQEQIKEFDSVIQDRRGFANTLTGDVAKLEIALEERLWLKNDFQVIIDLDGNVHLIDLTRPCVGTICSSDEGSKKARMQHQIKVRRILNGLRSLSSAVSETENADERVLVKLCSPGGTTK